MDLQLSQIFGGQPVGTGMVFFSGGNVTACVNEFSPNGSAVVIVGAELQIQETHNSHLGLLRSEHC
jgi:hypothetical protein